jgi:hypothetical protein
MPPKKLVKHEAIADVSDVQVLSVQHSMPKKSATPSSVKFSTNDSDRLQLAQAINNLTIKGDQFISALENLKQLDHERLTELDLQISAKKTEYQDLNLHLENEFKNNQIETNQKLNEFKIKACQEIASEHNMTVIKKEDYNKLQSDISVLHNELGEFKATFESKLHSELEKEKTYYVNKLKHEMSTLDLTHKAQCAELKAQCDQQKREIDILNKTIDNLKHEIAEQRNLTKEVAIAGSRAQITQKIGKD